MKYNDEQKELVALLPQDAKKYGLTDSAKLVWAQLIFMYGTDFAKDNGYIYRTNEALMEDTGIKSEHSVITAIRQLKSKGIITTKRGKRGEASEFILHKGLDENCSNEEKIAVINCSNSNENCSNKLQYKIEVMELTINDLLKRIENLEAEIAVIKSKNCSNNNEKIAVINCSNEIKNCSTDTESDTEKEKESGIREQGNEIEHEWNDEPIDFEYTDEMKRIGLKEVDNAEVKCLAQDQDNFNDNSKKKPNGNSNTTSNTDKNKWVTWYFNEMNSNLNALATSKTKATISGLQDKIADLLQLGLDKQDDFTEKQWSVVQNFADRYIKLIEIKQAYLKNTKNNESVQTSNNNASDVYTDDEWTSKVEQSFNASEETTKDNSSDSSREEELKPQKTEAEELNDHMMKLFAELDEQDKQNKALESKVQSTLTWDTLPF